MCVCVCVCVCTCSMHGFSKKIQKLRYMVCKAILAKKTCNVLIWP